MSFVLFTILFVGTIDTLCPDVLVSLRHLFRGLVCVFVHGDNLWRCVFPACDLVWRHSMFPHVSRDLSKLHTTYWKSDSCYVTTTVFLRYIYPSIVFNLNLCSRVGDETCEQTRTISLFRAFAFCISQSACKWSVFEQNWRWVSLCDLKFWQPWIGLIFFW